MIYENIDDLYGNVLRNNARILTLEARYRALASMVNAQNQPTIDPDEVEQLQIENNELRKQNEELTATNKQIAELSTSRCKKNRVLRSENEHINAIVGGLRVRLTNVSDLADERWHDNNRLAAENAHLRELLAVAKGESE